LGVIANAKGTMGRIQKGTHRVGDQGAGGELSQMRDEQQQRLKGKREISNCGG